MNKLYLYLNVKSNIKKKIKIKKIKKYAFVFEIYILFFITLYLLSITNNTCLCVNDQSEIAFYFFKQNMDLMELIYDFDKLTMSLIHKTNLKIENPILVSKYLYQDYIILYQNTKIILENISIIKIPENTFFLIEDYEDIFKELKLQINHITYIQSNAAQKIINHCLLTNPNLLINSVEINNFLEISKKGLIANNALLHMLNENLVFLQFLNQIDTGFIIKNNTNIPLNFQLFKYITYLEDFNSNTDFFENTTNLNQTYNIFKNLEEISKSTLSFNQIEISPIANISNKTLINSRGFNFK